MRVSLGVVRSKGARGSVKRGERERGERDSVSLFVEGAMDEERAAID